MAFKTFSGVFNFLIALNIMATMMSCQPAEKLEKGFEPGPFFYTGDRLNPELLWQLGRVGDESISPDGSKLLYSVTWYSKEKNRGFRDLYVFDFINKETKRITHTSDNENQAQWFPNGKKIGFLSSRSGSMQLWEIVPDGTHPKQITFIEGGIEGYKFAPNGKTIVLVKKVKLDSSACDLHPDLPEVKARIETDLMYRHWDQWHDYTYNHLLLAVYNEKPIYEAVDIMEGEPFHAPGMPHGGIEELAWSPDGKTIVYTSVKKKGKEYAFSTNSDLYLYHVDSGTTTNLTQGMMGYDRNPVFSPDGSKLAWESMARDGYESDQARLMTLDIKTGARTDLFSHFEESAHSICWAKDGNAIYFISDIQASDEIMKVDLDTKMIHRITNGVHDYKSIQWCEDQLLARKQSMSHPDELYLVSALTGHDEVLTHVNDEFLNQLSLGKVEKRWITTTDKKEMLVWVIYPPHFDPSKKYPAILYCQGGPQGTVSQFWSYRWNFQLMAANDYIVVAPNRRGLPGFGMEWLEQISKDYGGQNIDDYLSAIDNMAAEPYVDEEKLAAVGASYGGFSVFYLAGHHQKRFSAFISHCGIFNFEQQYLTTEEMWFVDWDFGGSYWDKSNLAAQRSYGFSPHHFVDQWDTPILVVHGENDFRIPYTQGMAAYNAALMNGVPAKFLFFPDENHWVLKPQNGILWQRTFFDWLDVWLKNDGRR